MRRYSAIVTASSTIVRPPPPALMYPSSSDFGSPQSARARCAASTWCWTPFRSGATGYSERPMPAITGVRSIGSPYDHTAVGRQIRRDTAIRIYARPRSALERTRMADMLKLGIPFGYWTAQPRAASNLVTAARGAEELGYDSVWTGESWSSDAFSPLAAVAAATDRIHLCTGIAQMSARSPATMAMHAMTLDGLSGGRFRLGIGVSGPQVVEGWYGRPFSKPLARTREYVEIIRRVLRRDEPVDFRGEHYPMPYRGEGAVGLGKPLKMITHPLRADVPIYLGAEGPRNVALAAEIADGWVPLYYSPYRPEVYADALAAAKPGFEIAVNVAVHIDDDVTR